MWPLVPGAGRRQARPSSLGWVISLPTWRLKTSVLTSGLAYGRLFILCLIPKRTERGLEEIDNKEKGEEGEESTWWSQEQGHVPVSTTQSCPLSWRWAANLVPDFFTIDCSLESKTQIKPNILPLVKYSLSIVITLNPMKLLNMKQQYKATQSAKICGIGDKVIWQRSPWLGSGRQVHHGYTELTTGCIKENTIMSKQ